MSTIAAVSKDNRAPSFWASTVGKKIVMAITGVILFGFVIAHLAGNLQVFEGPAKLNAYGAFLKGTPELLWTERVVLLVAVTLHIVAAVQLTLIEKASRPVQYAKREYQAATFASRTIRWGGVLLAVLFDRKFIGQGIARLLVIAPFFVMPTVSALIWKNMILHPVYGLIAQGMRAIGMQPIDWNPLAASGCGGRSAEA